MADIERLSKKTQSILSAADESMGLKLAAMKAVESTGVTHPPDVKRIAEDVVVYINAKGPESAIDGAIADERAQQFQKEAAELALRRDDAGTDWGPERSA